jgi:PAS domain S-box-containing protein
MTSSRSDTPDWQSRVFDSLAIPALILSPDKTIISANRDFLERYDVRLEDTVGISCRNLFADRLRDQDLPCRSGECPMENTLRTGRPHSVQRHIKGDGSPGRWEDRVFSPIVDDDGEVLYVIESIRDITHVKKLERMFSGMREFVDRVIQSSPAAIVAADRNGRVLLMNQAAQDLFGYPFTGAPQLNIQQLYPEGTAHTIMRKLREERRGRRGKLPPSRVNILTSAGEEVPVEMTAAIIYENDREIATMGIYNDLRDKLAVEKKLEQAQAQVVQSEKLASLGRLAAGVAHEINNPLTGILLYGSLMQEELEAAHPLRAQLGCVLEDATRCQEIVKGLLAYSRQASAEAQVFGLNELVGEGLALIRDQKLFLQVDLIKDLSEQELYIRGDRKQLNQVVVNLVMNALDAMEHQGVLTLRTMPSEDPDYARLEIADTGAGIDPMDLPQIFDPFFTTKDPGKGTGLGLSTAYGIVEENGGRISVKETGTQGTTFQIDLPRVQTPNDALPETIG